LADNPNGGGGSDNDRGYTLIASGSDPAEFPAIHQRFLNSEVAPFTGILRGPTLLAPFNRLPSFVAAGKINLNTISMQRNGQSEALKAIEYNFLNDQQRINGNDPLATPFFETRRGFSFISPEPARLSTFMVGTPYATNIASSDMQHLHAQYPTQFGGAYRPSIVSNFYPRVIDPGVNAQLRSRFGVESTLLRSVTSGRGNASTPRTAAQMLYTPDPVRGVNMIPPVELSDVTRNAFSRYQRATRLPNLVTNQSNVFAVWVTVSHFEFDPITGFGREYTDQAGKTKRERAFFIVDRTVPVGFVPGEDLNSMNTILTKRQMVVGQ
jgi:hypothetical protein